MNYKQQDEFVWLPCEVHKGPFPDERIAHVKFDNNEWVGFVNTSQLKSEGSQLYGRDYVRATVLAGKHTVDGVTLSIQGHSPASRHIKTNLLAIRKLSHIVVMGGEQH